MNEIYGSLPALGVVNTSSRKFQAALERMPPAARARALAALDLPGVRATAAAVAEARAWTADHDRRRDAAMRGVVRYRADAAGQASAANRLDQALRKSNALLRELRRGRP